MHGTTGPALLRRSEVLSLDFLTRPLPNLRYKVEGFRHGLGLKRLPSVFLSLRRQFADTYGV